MIVKPTARIHLLPAKEAPYVVILRRKPSKTYHIIRWNTQRDQFEHGSWFDGHLYVMRSDVSFDGTWMVYLARGASGQTWNGCCQLPFLKTHLEADAPGTYFGGGFWKDQNTLLTNFWPDTRGTIPFRVDPMPNYGTEDLGVVIPRMERDGWVRNGANRGTDRKISGRQYMVAKDGDDGWNWQFQKRGPTLEAFYRGYLEHGYTFEFRLREYPDLLDREVEWATFDAIGNLVFTRAGWVYRYSRSDLSKGKPGFAADLNPLTKEAVLGE